MRHLTPPGIARTVVTRVVGSVLLYWRDSTPVDSCLTEICLPRIGFSTPYLEFYARRVDFSRTSLYSRLGTFRPMCFITFRSSPQKTVNKLVRASDVRFELLTYAFENYTGNYMAYYNASWPWSITEKKKTFGKTNKKTPAGLSRTYWRGFKDPPPLFPAPLTSIETLVMANIHYTRLWLPVSSAQPSFTPPLLWCMIYTRYIYMFNTLVIPIEQSHGPPLINV